LYFFRRIAGKFSYSLTLIGRTCKSNFLASLVNGCDPALLEDGSAVRTVEVVGDPPCLRAARRTLSIDGRHVRINFGSLNGSPFMARLVHKHFSDIGWNLDELFAAENCKI
jgi:hypothetical protein